MLIIWSNFRCLDFLKAPCSFEQLSVTLNNEAVPELEYPEAQMSLLLHELALTFVQDSSLRFVAGRTLNLQRLLLLRVQRALLDDKVPRQGSDVRVCDEKTSIGYADNGFIDIIYAPELFPRYLLIESQALHENRSEARAEIPRLRHIAEWPRPS